jgi:hypothetical protein
MAPKKVIFKGIRTALIVGSILTLINQWQALFGSEPFRWIALILTYIVPFIVFVYSYHSNKHNEPIADKKPMANSNDKQAN